MTKFEELCESLQSEIINAYEQGTSMEDAEKLASKFLFAQLAVSAELKKADLDSRVRKSGVKSIRAAIYLDIVQKADKKPVEAQISAMIDTDSIVMGEQSAFDTAEVERDALERYYSIFGNGHVHFRNIAKGSFGS